MIEIVLILCCAFIINGDHTRDFELEKIKAQTIMATFDIRVLEEKQKLRKLDIVIEKSELIKGSYNIQLNKELIDLLGE